MATNEIHSTLKQVLTEFKQVENELNRPKEDVVPLSLCFGMRRMMKSMLQLYLLSNHVKYTEGKSLGDLLDHCIRLDKQFSTISLSVMPCTEVPGYECDGKYCLSVDTATECLKIAQRLKVLIQDRLQISDVEI